MEFFADLAFLGSKLMKNWLIPYVTIMLLHCTIPKNKHKNSFNKKEKNVYLNFLIHRNRGVVAPLPLLC